MNKLIFRLLIVSTLALAAVAANGQLPKIDPNVDRRAIVVTDDNFEVQKSKPVYRTKPRILYQVWITTDGMLHCRTAATLKSASIAFDKPKNAEGTSVSYGSSYALIKPDGSDAYLFNIAPGKYKETHSITLSITSTGGSQAEITLINKKVPEKYAK